VCSVTKIPLSITQTISGPRRCINCINCLRRCLLTQFAKWTAVLVRHINLCTHS
jgi:hypothetical protein